MAAKAGVICSGSHGIVREQPVGDKSNCHRCGALLDVLESSAQYGHFAEHLRKKRTRAEIRARQHRMWSQAERAGRKR